LSSKFASSGLDEHSQFLRSFHLQKTDSESANALSILECSCKNLRSRIDKNSFGDSEALVKSFIKVHLPLQLLDVFEVASFESKKDITFLLRFILRNLESIPALMTYFEEHKSTFVSKLLHIYANPEEVLHCGEIIRLALRSFLLHKELLMNYDIIVGILKNHLTHNSFDVYSDAFATVHHMLNFGDAQLVAKFLSENYEKFCFEYRKWLENGNYYTKRQCLGLLSNLLLRESNYDFRIRYVNSRTNLIMIMKMMGSESQLIRRDSYGVFRVFEANPDKSEEIQRIFENNKQKLELYCASMKEENALINY